MRTQENFEIMKKSFLALLILLTIISCGKKKKVLFTGSYEEAGVLVSTDEAFIDHDSAFHVYTAVASKKPWRIERAKNEAELKDSTYSLSIYFIPSGKLWKQKQYILKKPVGTWKTFYESGKIETESVYENGLLKGYETRYEGGKLKIKGELLPDSTFRHREYFESGTPLKEMTTDKTGKGSRTSYYCDGKIRETGPIMDFNPSGIWKIYDTAGNVKQDTIFGIKQTDKKPVTH